MKAKLHTIQIRNFKAFRNFTLNLEGRHLLLYGDNGAGKSSLYWALHAFLQSSRKPIESVSKYFDPDAPENLLNIHEQSEQYPTPGEIAVTLREEVTKIDTTYRISQFDHSTHGQPVILKGDLASDFITYRFFFGFSHFRNSEKFNVWPLFEKEILPFCVSTGALTPLQMWLAIQDGNPNPSGSRGLGGKRAFQQFTIDTEAFANVLESIVDSVSTEAQQFYDKHFSCDDPARLELLLKVTTRPSFSGTSQSTMVFQTPVIEFGIKVNGATVNRPQAFLNEAKLTQLALSVRFAASIVNLHDSDLKLLVLDDLLVSLDMSNRMKVVDILLNDTTLANYQKIILTHDLGLFQECKRVIGANHQMWRFQKLVGNATHGPKLSNLKTNIELAQQYLEDDQLAECGNLLRKYVEDSLASFIQRAKMGAVANCAVDNGESIRLQNQLKEAVSILTKRSYKDFVRLVQAEFSLDEIHELTSPDAIDLSKFVGATKEEKKKAGDLIGKLYAARPNFHSSIVNLLTEASRKQRIARDLLERVMCIKDRILNPASHAGTAPLYKKEAEDAIKVIQALQIALDDALDTL